jgi:hypothetical protein
VRELVHSGRDQGLTALGRGDAGTGGGAQAARPSATGTFCSDCIPIN